MPVFSTDLSTHSCDGRAVVALRGELDLVDAVAVAAALAVVAAREPQIIVDLAGLEFIDSSGVAALARGRRQAWLAGGDLVLAAPQQKVTPAAGYVGPLPAIAIGAVGAAACYFAGIGAKKIKRFDDAFGVTATHGIGGIAGMLMVGIFAQYRVNPTGLTASNGSQINGLISGDGALLWHQTLAVLAVIGLTAALTYGLGIIIRATTGLQATSEQEDLGLSAMFQDTSSPVPLSAALAPRPT